MRAQVNSVGTVRNMGPILPVNCTQARLSRPANVA
jgi:hypothetical protein